MTSSIFQERENYRPFEYPEFHEFHLVTLQSPWSPYEVDMSQDIIDFNNAPQGIKDIVGGILRGFTLQEMMVNDNWTVFIRPLFPKPEILSMVSAFSSQEATHALAYNHLDSTLGLDSYEALQADKTSLDKLAYFEKSLNDLDNIASRLAVFSGAVEGVSLYASFAVLLSLNKLGLFKGMTQILSWSVLDEELHSKAGILLYKKVEAEQGITLESRGTILEGFNNIVENEISFLENVFSNIPNKNIVGAITLDEAKSFVKHRANKKLDELGIHPYKNKFFNDDGHKNVADWFYPMTRGTTHNDFFALQRNGGAYSSKLDYDYTQIDIDVLKEMLYGV